MSQRMWAQHQRWQEAGWSRSPSDRWMWNPAQWLCQPLLLKSPSLWCSSHVPEAYQLWHTPNSFVFLILPTITSRGASFPRQMVQLSGDLMKSSALIAVKSRACVWTEPTRQPLWGGGVYFLLWCQMKITIMTTLHIWHYWLPILGRACGGNWEAAGVLQLCRIDAATGSRCPWC